MSESGPATGSETKQEPVTVSTTPGPPPEIKIDAQNPLPEASWLFRRLITIGIVINLIALGWYVASSLFALGDSEALLILYKWTLFFTSLICTYYFVGPSAAELVNMIQTSKIIQGGMGMAENAARRVGIPFPGGGRRPGGPPHPSPAEPPCDEVDAAPRPRS